MQLLRYINSCDDYFCFQCICLYICRGLRLSKHSFLFLKLNLLSFLNSIPPEGRTYILVTSSRSQSVQLFGSYGCKLRKLQDSPSPSFPLELRSQGGSERHACPDSGFGHQPTLAAWLVALCWVITWSSLSPMPWGSLVSTPLRMEQGLIGGVFHPPRTPERNWEMRGGWSGQGTKLVITV